MNSDAAATDTHARLRRQLEFLVEIDEVKNIMRQTRLMDGARQENDAEHSWHLALFVVVLAEHANAEDLDVCRAVKMALIHDVVEIDAGDTFLYDAKAREETKDRERLAADRVFGLLPLEQAREFRDLWEEFEDRQTPESKFAAAVDRLQPLMCNWQTDGYAWRQHDVTRDMVVDANKHIANGSRILWERAVDMIDEVFGSVKQPDT